MVRKLVDGRKGDANDSSDDINEIVIKSDSKRMDATSSQSIESCPLNGLNRKSNTGGNVMKAFRLTQNVITLSENLVCAEIV